MVSTLAVDPLVVATKVLGHDYWPKQAEILRALFRRNARVAIKSCHASSKTFTAADAILTALILGGDVLTTAPTSDQVKGQLWQEVGRTLRETARLDLAGWTVNLTEIKTPRGNFAIGRSTDQGVRLQGYHSRPGSFLLIIADEAPGVIPAIYGAIEGISAGGDVRLLVQGNPVVPSGPFFDIFDQELPGWSRFTISAFDTPNLAGLTLEDLLSLPEHRSEDGPRPYLVTRRWVREKYSQWGTEHPEWDARVMGEFPSSAANALIPGMWIDQAKAFPAKLQPGVELSAGIDVAGPGESETVLKIVQGGQLVWSQSWTAPDPRPEVIEALKGWLRCNLKRVNIDSIGIGWYFFLDVQAALKPFGVQVSAVNVALPSEVLDERQHQKFANKRAEYYWAVREAFQESLVAGLDDTTASQLRGILYGHEEVGKQRIKIESKDDARKRGVLSPDHAEAFMLALAPPDVGEKIGAAFAAQAVKPPDEWDQWIERGQGRQQGGGPTPWGLR